jgi:hypothetical protein
MKTKKKLKFYEYKNEKKNEFVESEMDEREVFAHYRNTSC